MRRRLATAVDLAPSDVADKATISSISLSRCPGGRLKQRSTSVALALAPGGSLSIVPRLAEISYRNVARPAATVCRQADTSHESVIY